MVQRTMRRAPVPWLDKQPALEEHKHTRCDPEAIEATLLSCACTHAREQAASCGHANPRVHSWPPDAAPSP